MRQTLLLQNEVETPLGRLRLVGEIEGGRGVVPSEPLRVYGAYAVACITRGSGTYRDANGVHLPIRSSHALLVFPELAHWYGPRRGQNWDELYVTFDGPVFELWRQVGLLSPRAPVLPYETPWFERLRALFVSEERPVSRAGRLRLVWEFTSLLSELLLDAEDKAASPEEATAAPTEWRARACGLLEIDLGLALDMEDVAAEAGMSYESFRKRFQKEVGISPARYRMGKRIEAAKELLRYSPQITNRQIAQTLGFSDEFHFSRRFTEWAGTTPRAFRQRR